jgi:ATP-dependent exoDNAse (exonuclease V) alpha subunit
MEINFEDVDISKKNSSSILQADNNITDDNNTDEIDIKTQYKSYAAENPDLIKNLKSIGLGETLVAKAIDYFGMKFIYDILFKENVYKLMEIEGFGFTKADNCAKQLSYKSEDPRRQRALILSVLETNKNFGNVYLNTTILEKECKKQNVLLFNERLKEMLENKELIIEENRIYLNRLHVAEVEVAKMLRDLLS